MNREQKKPLFAILFDSSKVDLTPALKQRLQAVFKANETQVEKLCLGKPVPLKKGLSRVDAIRYRSMLQKAGIAVEIYPPFEKKRPAAPEAASQEKSADTTLSVAPVGSDLSQSHGQSELSSTEPDTSGISLAGPFGNLIEEEEREVEAAVVVEEQAIDWQLSQEGERLLREEELNAETAAAPDTSQLNLEQADPGHFKELKEELPPVQVDISHLQFLPEDK